MSITFNKAPLVELICELRWSPPQDARIDQQAGNPASTFISMNAGPFEEFFMRFGGGIHQLGFQLAERVAPSGFPIVAFQPVFRFRHSAKSGLAVLYQIGAGIFSANAIPPYKTWNEFAPVVSDGVAVLLQTRGENDALREQVVKLVALVDHYYAAWQENRTLLARRERELAELRRNIKPQVVSIRS